MPVAAPLNFRPLLRLDSIENISALQLARHGYGGIILDASARARESFTSELIAGCRAQNLEVWMDVSRLHHNQIPRLVLEFDGTQPHFSRSASTLLDPFDERSASFMLQSLEAFDAAHITGVLYEAHWRDASTSPLSPFPWAAQLEEQFDAAQLAALVSNTGDDAAQIRQQYWQALNGLRARMTSQLRAACEAKNWQLIAREETPECEALQLDEVLRARYDQHWPALLRDDSPAELLRQCYRFLHAGTRRFQIEYSTRAFSRGAKLLNDAIERGAQKFAGTRNVARIGVLFPARSCQTHYHPAGHRFLRWVADDLKRITRALDELHFDWIFVSESEPLPAADSLEMIVVPSVTALLSSTWDTCEQFVEDGNKVACLGLLPRWNENGRDRNWEQQVGKAALLSIEDLYAAYAAAEDDEPLPPTIGFPVFREHLSGGRLCCYQPRLNEDAADTRLRVHQILHESLAPDFDTQSRDVLYSHHTRESDANGDDANHVSGDHASGDDEFFIFNNSDEARHVNARLRPELETLKGAHITTLDAATGEQRVLAVWMPHPIEQGGGLSLSLDLARGEARFVTISKSRHPEIRARIESANFEIENFDGKVARGYATHSGIQKLAVRGDKKLQWREGEFLIVPAPILLDDEWSASKPNEGEPDDREPNERSENTVREYSQSVELPDEWRACRIFLELARFEGAVEVAVNGEACGAKFSAPLRFEISRAARVGAENFIALRPDAQDTAARSELSHSELELIARLVAYPQVEVAVEAAMKAAIEPVKESHESL